MIDILLNLRRYLPIPLSAHSKPRDNLPVPGQLRFDPRQTYKFTRHSVLQILNVILIPVEPFLGFSDVLGHACTVSSDVFMRVQHLERIVQKTDGAIPDVV
jgi:hypothetical protein